MTATQLERAGVLQAETRGIVVKAAILHHLASPALQCSSRPIDLAESPDFTDYLAGEVANVLSDAHTRSAKITDLAVPGPVAICEALVGGKRDLVDSSCELAGLLNNAIGRDSRITPGIFVVVQCTRVPDDASEHPPPTPHPELVAMLKLDLGPTFQEDWRTDEHGDLYLSARKLNNVLPAPREQLHKAAIIQVDPSGNTRLMVLDRQISGPPANFFLAGFLRAEVEYTDAELTKELALALWTAYSKLDQHKILSPEQLNDLATIITAVFAATDFNLADLALEVPAVATAAIKAEFAARPKLAMAFTLDDKTKKALTDKVRYSGDFGLKVEVKTGFEDIIKDKPPARPDGQHTITIKTKTWRRR